MVTTLDKILSAPAVLPRRGGGQSTLDQALNAPLSFKAETETLENIERYNKQLREAGIEPPKAKNVLGTVNRILDILRTGEYAVGGIIAGKGPIAGVKEKISPSEVFGITPKETKSFWSMLKQPQFYGALAVDILLDPITYLTFGFGGGAKIATSAGTKILNKSGKKFLQKSIKQFGSDAGRKMMATHILREGGEKYLATGGIKFMGREFIPRSIVQAPFHGINHVVERTPLVGFSFIKTKQLLSRAFKPMAEITELPAQMGGAGRYEEMVMVTQKGIRGETERQLKYLRALANSAQKAGIKGSGRQITAILEFDVKSGNKALDDIASYMQGRLREFGFAEQKRGILNIGVAVEMPGYMRHLLTKEGREFLEKGGRKVQQEFIGNIQKLKVTTPFAKARKLKGNVFEINNIYKDKYKVKLFEEDAFKAFGQRTFEHIKATKVYDFFNNLVDQRIAIKSPMVPQLVKKIGQPWSSIKKPLNETVIDGIKYVQSKVPQLEGFLIPEPIVKHLNETYRFFVTDEVSKGFLGLYDKLLRFWKGTVTGWFPAFHSRNFLGGMWNNWLAGLRDPTRYLQGDRFARGLDAKKTFTNTLGEKKTGEEIIRAVEDLGVTGAPGMIDVMKNTEEMMRIGKVAQAKALLNFPRIGMEVVEDRLRIPLFFDRWMKGDSFEEAAKTVFKFHFDYAPEAFTAFERNVIRRLIPFYTWTRGNVPLQIEQLIAQPRKFVSLEKFRRNIEAGSGTLAIDENEYLPQWMKEMFIFRLPGESTDGLPRYLQLDLPIEDINKLPFTESGRREIIALLSPFIKYPIERIANRNLYFGSEIYDASLPKEYQTAKTIEVLKFLPQPVRDYLNFQEFRIKNPQTGEYYSRYEMDALKLHATRSVLAGRFYSTIGTATDSELDVWAKLSRLLGGVPVRAVDIEEERLRRLREQQFLSRDVLNYLKRKGVMDKAKEFRGGSTLDIILQTK